MSYAIMFVCSACVCRSPLMAFAFSRASAADSPAIEWRIESRGVEVQRDDAMCDVAARLIADDAGGVEFAALHVSSPVLADELADFDLVITASRRERGAVAKLDPGMRARTFTLKEAIALGRTVEADDWQGSGQLASPVPLTTYASLLNSRRGRITTGAESRLRAPWSYSSDTDDFPDVHHERRARHAGGLKELRQLVTTFHNQVEGFIARHP